MYRQPLRQNCIEHPTPLIGGPGADVLNGGSGNDRASYRPTGTGLFAGIEARV